MNVLLHLTFISAIRQIIKRNVTLFNYFCLCVFYVNRSQWNWWNASGQSSISYTYGKLNTFLIFIEIEHMNILRNHAINFFMTLAIWIVRKLQSINNICHKASNITYNWKRKLEIHVYIEFMPSDVLRFF